MDERDKYHKAGNQATLQAPQPWSRQRQLLPPPPLQQQHSRFVHHRGKLPKGNTLQRRQRCCRVAEWGWGGRRVGTVYGPQGSVTPLTFYLTKIAFNLLLTWQHLHVASSQAGSEYNSCSLHAPRFCLGASRRNVFLVDFAEHFCRRIKCHLV